jgi:hypothetical protein
MNSFISTFEKLWCIDIKEHFQNGYITWEHQLQAHLYHLLKCNLNSIFKIWIEPVLYIESNGLDKIRPDMVITFDKKIIAIIELKVKAWEYPLFKGDIEKLERLKSITSEQSIDLGFIPVTNDWNKQKLIEGKNLSFSFDKQWLAIMAIIAKPDSEAFTTHQNEIKIFKGFIDNNDKIIFE